MAAKRPKPPCYLDTSALLKLLVDEPGSAEVRTAARNASVLLCSRLGRTEAAVSLARMVHLGRLAAADLPHLLGNLDDYWDQSIQEIPLSDEVLEQARNLAQRFPLRTYDAIHLASAREARIMLRAVSEGEMSFLAFDKNLSAAAKALSFAEPV